MLLVLLQNLRSFVLSYQRDELYNGTVPFWSQNVWVLDETVKHVRQEIFQLRFWSVTLWTMDMTIIRQYHVQNMSLILCSFSFYKCVADFPFNFVNCVRFWAEIICMLFLSDGDISIGHFNFRQVELNDFLQVEFKYPNKLLIYSGREWDTKERKGS